VLWAENRVPPYWMRNGLRGATNRHQWRRHNPARKQMPGAAADRSRLARGGRQVLGTAPASGKVVSSKLSEKKLCGVLPISRGRLLPPFSKCEGRNDLRGMARRRAVHRHLVVISHVSVAAAEPAHSGLSNISRNKNRDDMNCRSGLILP